MDGLIQALIEFTRHPAALSGGFTVVGSVLTYVATRKRTRVDAQTSALAAYQDIAERLDQSREECEQGRRECQEENADLRQRVEKLERNSRLSGGHQIVG